MFFDRMVTVFSRIMVEHESPILITAHGGFMHQIQRFLGHPGDIVVKNCHLHYFDGGFEDRFAAARFAQ